MQTHSCKCCGCRPFAQSALSSISWALLGWRGEMMMPFISLAERRAWKPDELSPPKPFFSPVFYDRKDFLGLVGLFFSPLWKVFSIALLKAPPVPSLTIPVRAPVTLFLATLKPSWRMCSLLQAPEEEEKLFPQEIVSFSSGSASWVSARCGTPQGGWQALPALGRQSWKGQSI